MMKIDRIFGYAILGFFFGIAAFIKGLSWFKRKRLIEDIPTSKIRSIAMGPVEIYGEVVPAKDKILKSPFSNSSCVYYKYCVEEWHSDRHGGHWDTIKSEKIWTHFFIKDETGCVLVDPTGANIDVRLRFSFESGRGKDPPELVKKFLDAYKISYKGIFGNKRMRFEEYFIAPGDKLYIMGTAGDNPFVEEGWAQTSTEDVMIQKGENNTYYYISDKSEKAILTQLSIMSKLGVFGGGILTVGCLFVILLYLGLI